MIQITADKIDLTALLPLVSHPDCGAQVMFVGTTRQWTGEVETEFLYYETYEQLARAKMSELEQTARTKWPVREVVLVHRVGRVDVCEPSVAVLVSSPHRSEAFEAAKWLIDELKHTVPIWKQEHYVQRGAEWIHPSQGSCNCDTHRPERLVESSIESIQQSATPQIATQRQVVQQQSVQQQATQQQAAQQ